MNGGYRPPPPRAASKATASTVCQKCLKRGHFSYECKAAAQERPYVARPSRTQQLLNPRLLPKLNSDVPNDLLRKKGVADEVLAQNAKERGRKRSRDGDDVNPHRKRSRSESSMSTSSVSTISTTASRSPSPSKHPDHDEYMTSQQVHSRHSSHKPNGKRRRRSSSAESRSSDMDVDRNTRRRRKSVSPVQRGRRRSRPDSGMDGVRNSRSRSGSRSGRGSRRISRSPRRDEDMRRPMEAGSRSPFEHGRDGRDKRDGKKWGRRQEEQKVRYQPRPRERSMSPYSKRLALTQAMNVRQ